MTDRRFRSLPRFLLGAIGIALATTAGVAALAIGAVSTIAADIALGGKPVHSKFLRAAAPGAPETIMVIGDDHSGPFIQKCQCHLLHADTFMLLRMDPGLGQTSIMSIPRDLMVSFKWGTGQYTDQKFNAAYSIGGDALVLKVASQELPQVPINHVIDVNFSAFIGVVRAIGCVYVDVDHRYLNNLDPSYQPINLWPGYQRLCAEPALSYVRYRHDDSDLVRVARQQDFIRQAKEQLGLFDLVSKFDQIAHAFGKAIHTDIRGAKEIDQLLRLVLFSQSKPIRQVSFQYDNGDYQLLTPSGVADYVTSTPKLIAASEYDFLHGHPQPASTAAATRSGSTTGRSGATVRHHRHHHHHAATTLRSLDLFTLASGVASQALTISPKVPFPVYLPRYQTGPAAANDFHAYTVRDESGNLHYGYRVDWYLGAPGEYYGIEGMNWTTPPLFANPSGTQTIGGRSYIFVDDPPHYHYIGWRTGKALYWISNTLNESLSNDQMMRLAESAHAITG